MFNLNEFRTLLHNSIIATNSIIYQFMSRKGKIGSHASDPSKAVKAQLRDRGTNVLQEALSGVSSTVKGAQIAEEVGRAGRAFAGNETVLQSTHRSLTLLRAGFFDMSIQLIGALESVKSVPDTIETLESLLDTLAAGATQNKSDGEDGGEKVAIKFE